jgi:hypothetical protein
MERGELGITVEKKILFVFEDMLASVENKRAEKVFLRLHQWEAAVNCWHFRYTAMEHMRSILRRRDVTPGVITWHSHPFAQALKDRLWAMGLTVDVTASEYRFASPLFATDPDVLYVYDPDPEHRFGYGFKAREFVNSSLI